MDWRVQATTLGVIFLAELGDKTQLSALAMAGRSRAPVAVFLGAVGALILATLLSVTLGEAITRVIPAAHIQRASAVLFLAVGAFMLVSS